MVKIFDAKPSGATAVVVNPDTGRIYAFYDASVQLQLNDEVAQLVFVDVRPEEFAQEHQQGLFYKDGAFYRSWQPPEQEILAWDGKAIIKVKGPEEKAVEARLIIDEKINEVLSTNEQGELIYEAEFDFGVHHVRIFNDEWGRATVKVYANPLPQSIQKTLPPNELPNNPEKMLEKLQVAQTAQHVQNLFSRPEVEKFDKQTLLDMLKEVLKKWK